MSECVPGILGAVELGLASFFGINALTLISSISLNSSKYSGSDSSPAEPSTGGHWRSTATFNILLVPLLGFPQARPSLGPPTWRGQTATGATSPLLWAAAPRPPGPVLRSAHKMDTSLTRVALWVRVSADGQHVQVAQLLQDGRHRLISQLQGVPLVVNRGARPAFAAPQHQPSGIQHLPL